MNMKYFIKELYLGMRGICIRLFIHPRPAVAADPDSIRSILVIRVDRIGDVVISLPAIRALRAIFPNAKISVLANRSCAPLLQGVPYISEVITYTGLRRSIACLREKKFDIAADLLMDYSIKTAIISLFSAAPVRIGFDIASRGRFFNIAVTPDTKEKHMSEHTLDIARSIGRFYRAEDRADWEAQPHLKASEDAMAAADEILNRSGISKDDRIVIIHPGGHFPSQRWMPGAFAELADRIAERYNAKIIIIGDSSERELVEGIVSRMKIKPAFIVGHGLDVIAAVISLSDLLICNNSGPLHIASALGTPTVSTMGPTVPHLWRPLGNGHAVLHRNLPCSPCSTDSCAHHECMRQILVDEMEEAAALKLEKSPPCRKEVFNMRARKGETDKILVINLGGIGDVILSTPALRALKNTYPRAIVYFLGIERVSEFVKHLPYVDETLNFDFDISPGSIIGNIKTLLYLRSLKIGLAINMRTLVSGRSALKFKILLRLIRPKITAGRDTEGMGGGFDIRIPESRAGDKSEMEYDLDTVRALGGEIISRHPDFPMGEVSLNKVQSMLVEHGISEGDILIGVHPGGKPSHRWPAERFAEVIKAISDKVKAKFIITGDREDAAAAETIIRSSKAEIIDATGRLGLGELGAIIRHCNLYICNDTAAMHIAAILKVPLIAIFGPGYLKRFDPRNIYKDAVVIHRETVCAPCDKTICRNMECLKTIDPADVASAALKLLKAV